ncbi:MAG: hypothetical protein FWG83_01185 [Oscillospiraceae bacterium]|nr:hypothetical protein [Oscillospiraceae bacterium]
MRKKVLKRLISVLLVCVIAVSTVTIQSEAHIESESPAFPGNNWRGSNGHTITDIKIYINSSSITGPLIMDIYYRPMIPVLGWNAVSNCQVNISEIKNTGSPTSYDWVLVRGAQLESGVGGRIYHRNMSGNLITIDETNRDSNWYRAEIHMTTSMDFWQKKIKVGKPGSGGPSDPSPTDAQIKDRARTVFMHEVGHALKLCHPVTGSTPTSTAGHNIRRTTYTGPVYYPYSVMNTGGYPDQYEDIRASRQEHDTQNLRARWG